MNIFLRLIMVTTTFFGSFFSFANLNLKSGSKNTFDSTQRAPQEIVREFHQPIEFYKQSLENNGKWAFLFLPKFYNTKVYLKIPNQDLKIIKKEAIQAFLKFNLKIDWWGPKQGSKTLNVNLSKLLSFSSFQTPLECGEIFWSTVFSRTLKIKPLIRFSWSKNLELTLEHLINDFLEYEKLISLSSFQGNGLGKMTIKLSNLKLVYKIPEIFSQLSKISQPVIYFADPKNLIEIDKLVNHALKTNLFLKKLKFDEYFKTPKLSQTQKTNLLAINKNLTSRMLLNLELKEKYDEEIFQPLKKYLNLVLVFHQQIDLNQISLNKVICLEKNTDPKIQFLNNNLFYKNFFLESCNLVVKNQNTLVITPKSHLKKVIFGRLELVISWNEKEIQKSNLNSLNLVSFLGIFTLKDEYQILDSKIIFERWKELNNPLLADQNFDSYLFEPNFSQQQLVIMAKSSNKFYEGFVVVSFKFSYQKLQKRDLKSLNLKTNLGVLEFDNSSSEQKILNLFFFINSESLLTLNASDYGVKINFSASNGVIQTTKQNKFYFGTLPIVFQNKSHKNLKENNNKQDSHLDTINSKKPKNFFKNYWWILVFLVCGVVGLFSRVLFGYWKNNKTLKKETPN